MTSRFAGNPDYRLRWPPDVLRTELAWLASQDHIDVAAAELVLEEAFLSEEPKAALERAGAGWGEAGRDFVLELLEAVDKLPQRRRPAPLA